MTADGMTAVLERYAQAKNRQDVEAALAECTDDCFYESVAFGGRVQGKEALRAFYTGLFEALPDYRAEFDGFAFGELTAVAWGRFGGTVEGEFMGAPATGHRISVPVTFVCTFRDGRISGDTGYFDLATLCEQAGVPMETLRPASRPQAA